MKKKCGRCQAERFRRVNRVGFFERSVLPLLGFFPWECALCRRKVMLRDDGLQWIMAKSRAHHLVRYRSSSSSTDTMGRNPSKAAGFTSGASARRPASELAAHNGRLTSAA
jgi:hypothetical protein